MKLIIDRTHCDLCQSYCDRHVAKLVRFPLGEDRPCIQSMVEDGQELLTVVVKDGDHEITLHLQGDNLETASSEGLSTFLPWNYAKKH